MWVLPVVFLRRCCNDFIEPLGKCAAILMGYKEKYEVGQINFQFRKFKDAKQTIKINFEFYLNLGDEVSRMGDFHENIGEEKVRTVKSLPITCVGVYPYIFTFNF